MNKDNMTKKERLMITLFCLCSGRWNIMHHIIRENKSDISKEEIDTLPEAFLADYEGFDVATIISDDYPDRFKRPDCLMPPFVAAKKKGTDDWRDAATFLATARVEERLLYLLEGAMVGSKTELIHTKSVLVEAEVINGKGLAELALEFRTTVKGKDTKTFVFDDEATYGEMFRKAIVDQGISVRGMRSCWRVQND